MINFYKHSLVKGNNNVNKILSTVYLTSGPECEKVQKILSKRFNKSCCILTNSWTNGLIALLKSLKLKKNDEVIIPACTFVACANVVEMIGARVVFADIDKNTKLMDIEDTLSKITNRTKVIMPVHLYGNLFNTYEFKKKLKKKTKKKIYLIEDSAHCFDGKINNKPIGFYSDFAVFSFYATKNITCGEGGAIISDNKGFIEKIKSISNNGLSSAAIKRFQKKKYVHWDVKDIGFKANLSDINASFLEDQIKKYKKNLLKRKKIYKYLKRNLENIKGLSLPKNNLNIERDYHLFPIGVTKERRDAMIKYLNLNNIPTTVNYKSILKLTFYKKKYKNQKCKESEKWGDQTLSIPFHLNLKRKDLNYIIKKIHQFFYK